MRLLYRLYIVFECFCMFLLYVIVCMIFIAAEPNCKCGESKALPGPADLSPVNHLA